MALPPFLSSLVSWLRAGYPAGIPDNDYVALIALLARRLTSEEVAAVAAELTGQVAPLNGSASAVNGTATDGSEHATGSGDARASGAPNSGDVAVDNADIGVQITKITNEMPREEDIARVRSRLAAAGPFL